jgi:hypothetical protein
MSDRSRRDALKVVAATVPVLPVLNAQDTHQHHAKPAEAKKPGGAYKPKALSADEFETLGVLVDLIIPRTDTPGARDAGVHASIDKQCAASNRLRASMREGLRSLNAVARKVHQRPFARLEGAQQVALLQPLSEGDDPFFKTVKNFTVESYYTSEEGLTRELEWNANTFLAEFKGCTHKEHQG